MALMVPKYCVSQLAKGCSGSPVRTFLASVQLLWKLHLIPTPVEPILWRLPMVPQRLGRLPSRPAAEIRWISTLANHAATPQDWLGVATAVLALCLALRSSEVSSLDDRSFAHDGTVSFKREKCWRENSATRQLPDFAWGWARWFRTLRKFVEVDPVRTYHRIRERSRLPYTPFHSWRRATARALFSAGVTESNILWCW